MLNATTPKIFSDVQSGFTFLDTITNNANPTSVATVTIEPRATHYLLQAVGGDIWFTLDGSTPAVDGAAFKLVQDAPFIAIPVNSTFTLKFITNNSGDLKYAPILAYN